MKDAALVLCIVCIMAMVLGAITLPEEITILRKYWEYSTEDSVGNCFVISGEEAMVHVNMQELYSWNVCKNPRGLIFYVTYKDAAGKICNTSVKPDL